MSYIQSHLQEGEQVVMRISPRRGLVGVLAVLVLAALLTASALLLVYMDMILAAIVAPSTVGLDEITTIILSAIVVFILLVAVVLLPIRFILDVIRRFTAEVALTDRRLFGRGGVQPWSRFDWPIEEVISVHYSWPLQPRVQFMNRKGRTVKVVSFYRSREFAQVVERALTTRAQSLVEEHVAERLKPA